MSRVGSCAWASVFLNLQVTIVDSTPPAVFWRQPLLATTFASDEWRPVLATTFASDNSSWLVTAFLQQAVQWLLHSYAARHSAHRTRCSPWMFEFNVFAWTSLKTRLLIHSLALVRLQGRYKILATRVIQPTVSSYLPVFIVCIGWTSHEYTYSASNLSWQYFIDLFTFLNFPEYENSIGNFCEPILNRESFCITSSA